MGGINDIYTRHDALPWQTRPTYTFDWQSQGQFMNTLCEIFETNVANLHKELEGQRVIICPLIGAELAKTCTNATAIRQQWLDNTVWSVNNTIYHLNRYAMTSTPWISRAVHTSHVKTGRKVRYDKLEGGLHFKNSLTTEVATTLVNHIGALKSKIELNGYTPS